ncbi:MAG: lysophospholipid acyltransferase family protein [Candidatus Gastranaerophilaceae bacterium]
MFKKYMEKKFSKRDAKEFNVFRKTVQWIICHWLLGGYIRFFYKIEISGLEKLDKTKKYLIAANHLSGYDPFVVAYALNQPLAFMAKEELFESFMSRWLMDWCGAFSVNREKLEVSTIKTAIAITKTDWHLGIFPQGTRDKSGKINHITRGFVALAKASKCDILPVSIMGIDKKSTGFQKGTITIKIGDMIPCGEVDETIQKWCETISTLSGLEYQPS